MNMNWKSLYKSAKSLGADALELLTTYAGTMALIALFALSALKLPEIQNKYYRSHVGSKVYMIKNSKAERSGGTGFAVKSPSGASYILTNDHVCGVSKDKQTVEVVSEDGSSMRRRILAHDGNSDLCLIEGLPGIEGLRVARSGPALGDSLWAVGHPRLMPTHVSHGEMTGEEDVQIMMGPISVLDPDGKDVQIPPESGGILAEQCTLPKNKIQTIDIEAFFATLKVKICIVEVKGAYITSAIVHPGNSGSPVVNFWGNVEGVVFASDGTNWGRMVSLDDIKEFLKNY